MRSEKTKQSHVTIGVAQALSAATATAGTTQAVLQTACARTIALDLTEDGARLRSEVARLSQLATELAASLASLAAAAEAQAWALGRAGQEEERQERLAAERAKLAGEG